MSLVSELKRRNVFRVAASYAIVAWIVLQVADTTFPALNIPAWVLSLLTVLLLLGLPIALVLAWAYELTPDGIKPTAEVPVEQSIRGQTGQRMNSVIMGGLALLLVLVVLDAYILRDVEAPAATEGGSGAIGPSAPAAEATAAPPAAPTSRSVAVMPFANLSDDPDQDYFSDGLTEELINKLSQVTDLHVTGRNSSFYYKDRDEALLDIGRELGVAHLLQGSVRKVGNQMRISAQLLDVASNTNIWTQTYDRSVADIFAIQDEIAAAVTTALSVALRAGQFSDPAMTGSVEAYEGLLRAQVMRRDAVAARISELDLIAQLEKVVSIDPEFATAWIMLYQAYANPATALRPSEREGFEAKAQRALERANALVPGHRSLTLVKAQQDIAARLFLEAENALQALLAEVPGDLSALGLYGQLLLTVGRPTDALRVAEQARRIDPLAEQSFYAIANAQLYLGRMQEARAEMARAEALGITGWDSLRAIAALQEGDTQGAIRIYTTAPTRGGTTRRLAEVWRDEGDAAALALMHELNAREDISTVGLTLARQFAAALGAHESGMDLLQRQNIVTGDVWLPLYGELRRLPDFRDWVRSQGLLAYWQASSWGEFCRPLANSNDDFECF